jgi:hypothetical protein
MEGCVRELALLDLGIDSKLRECDLVALEVWDVCHGDEVASRAVAPAAQTQHPVQFEITQAARDAVRARIRQAALKPETYLFPSRLHESPHLHQAKDNNSNVKLTGFGHRVHTLENGALEVVVQQRRRHAAEGGEGQHRAAQEAVQARVQEEAAGRSAERPRGRG